MVLTAFSRVGMLREAWPPSAWRKTPWGTSTTTCRTSTLYRWRAWGSGRCSSWVGLFPDVPTGQKKCSSDIDLAQISQMHPPCLSPVPQRLCIFTQIKLRIQNASQDRACALFFVLVSLNEHPLLLFVVLQFEQRDFCYWIRSIFKAARQNTIRPLNRFTHRPSVFSLHPNMFYFLFRKKSDIDLQRLQIQCASNKKSNHNKAQRSEVMIY